MRKTRSDCRVGTFEKKHGLPPGTIRNKMEEIPEVTKKLAPFAKKQSRNIIMEKKIRKRYHSEEAVKKALKIESFRNLTKDKVMEFTSMIPYMERKWRLK